MDKPLVLPNLLVAGAPKCGTSSVHGWLSDHPDVIGSLEKETYFLSDPGSHMHRPSSHVSDGLGGYAAHFPPGAADAKVLLESTPGYLYSDTARSAVATFPTMPKVLFILREPSAQIYSLFRYFQNNWNWVPADMDFAAFIEASRTGSHDFMGNELAQNCLRNAAYVDHLIKWRDILGDCHMKITLFDDLQDDQQGFMTALCDWLELAPEFYQSYGYPRENETYQPRSRKLQSANLAIRAMLPKGAAYTALRHLYRRLNTRKPDPASRKDAVAVTQLRGEYRGANQRLAETFELDLSRWN